MATATTTPTEGTPFLSTQRPMLSVKSGRQRLKTTYMGRLRPRRDQSVSVDWSVDRTQTGANSCRGTQDAIKTSHQTNVLRLVTLGHNRPGVNGPDSLIAQI